MSAFTSCDCRLPHQVLSAAIRPGATLVICLLPALIPIFSHTWTILMVTPLLSITVIARSEFIRCYAFHFKVFLIPTRTLPLLSMFVITLSPPSNSLQFVLLSAPFTLILAI